MKAHWMNDGEQVLVTGTLNPKEAAQYVMDTEPDMADFIEGMDGDAGEPTRGYFRPCNHSTQEYTGFKWHWMATDTGRVKAVVFG